LECFLINNKNYVSVCPGGGKKEGEKEKTQSLKSRYSIHQSGEKRVKKEKKRKGTQTLQGSSFFSVCHLVRSHRRKEKKEKERKKKEARPASVT